MDQRLWDDGTPRSVRIKNFFLNIHPKLSPVRIGKLVSLLNNVNPRNGLQLLLEIESITAFKKNMEGGFKLLFTEMVLRIDVHPNPSKIGISGNFVKSEKPKKILYFIRDIGLLDGLEWLFPLGLLT